MSNRVRSLRRPGSVRLVLDVVEKPDAQRGRSLAAILIPTTVGSAAVAVASFWPLLIANAVNGVVDVMVVVALTVTGAVLLQERDQRATGISLALVAACYLVSWWWTWPLSWQVGPVPLVSYVTGYLWFVLGVAALLRYPQPRLAHWWDRVYVAVLGAWVVVPKLILATLSEPRFANLGYPTHAWWPTLHADEALFLRGSAVANIGLVVVAVAALVPIALKVHRSSSVDRIDAVPSMVAAATVMICGSIYLVARSRALPHETLDALRAVIGVAVLFTPVAFLGSALRRRLARASLADLVVRLSHAATPGTVQDELRRSLSDPSARVWFWLPDEHRWAGVDDEVVDDPDATGRHRVDVHTADEAPLAVLLLDPALQRHPSLVAPAVAACRFALENSRMHADLRVQLAELQASAARIAQAELRGRSRIERDLHDGAQQTLWAVRMSLGEAERLAQPSTPAHNAVVQAQTDLKAAIDELRRLARGIAPPVLRESGLRVALDGVIERLGAQIERNVATDRFDPAVENTAYFVACEALTNAVKHADAAHIRLTVARRGPVLAVEVADDGTGGARATTGSGVVGIRDRIRTLGGTMTIDSPAGGGTCVSVTFPCA